MVGVLWNLDRAVRIPALGAGVLLWTLSFRWWIPVWISGNLQQRMEQHFRKFPEKKKALRGIPKLSETSYRNFQNFHLNGCFSEIQQFSDFLENFPGNFCNSCPYFEIFCWMESAPMLSHCFSSSCCINEYQWFKCYREGEGKGEGYPYDGPASHPGGSRTPDRFMSETAVCLDGMERLTRRRLEKSLNLKCLEPYKFLTIEPIFGLQVQKHLLFNSRLITWNYLHILSATSTIIQVQFVSNGDAKILFK